MDSSLGDKGAAVTTRAALSTVARESEWIAIVRSLIEYTVWYTSQLGVWRQLRHNQEKFHNESRGLFMSVLSSPDYEAVEQASRRLMGVAHRTPVLSSTTLNRYLGAE